MAFKMIFDVKYQINDGAVICFVSPLKRDKATAIAYEIFLKLTGRHPKARLKTTYKGIARRKEGDEDNLELAKEIARKKALRAAYKGFYNLNWELYKGFDHLIEEYFVHMVQILKKISKMTEEIINISNEDF